MSQGKSQNQEVYELSSSDLPEVAIVFAAYNEEAVMKEKLELSLKTTYPIEKLTVVIGSDASVDNTDAIVREFQKNHPNVKLKVFEGRTGKVEIINELVEDVNAEVLVMTDANVFFTESTIYELVKHYKNPKVGLVGGNILNVDIKKDGISGQEDTYLSQENKTKYREGVLWGTMMGAFGGVYSMRKSLYQKVPANFIVDDYFLTMVVIEQKYQAIIELNAVCYEHVSNKISEEFRRKTRISAGNFQNLNRFKRFINPFSGRGMAFISHKVLRWCGPFFIIGALICSGILALNIPLYRWIFFGQVGLITIPLIDLVLRKLKIHFVGFRFVSHFYAMNLALLLGFFKYVKGIKSSVWTPTDRTK